MSDKEYIDILNKQVDKINDFYQQHEKFLLESWLDYDIMQYLEVKSGNDIYDKTKEGNYISNLTFYKNKRKYNLSLALISYLNDCKYKYNKNILFEYIFNRKDLEYYIEKEDKHWKKLNQAIYQNSI